MDNIFNINFPILNSDKGYFIDLTTNSRDGLLANIKHVLLTTKGTRYYKPSFGANLRRFLFDPNDNITHDDLKMEIQEILNNYFPSVKIRNIEVLTGGDVSSLFNENLRGVKTSTKKPNKNNVAKIRITIEITQGTFANTEIIDLQF